MTELRRRGGGGEDPDSTDNISDKVKIEQNKKTNLTNKNLPGASQNAPPLRLATSAAEQVSPVAVLCGALRGTAAGKKRRVLGLAS